MELINTIDVLQTTTVVPMRVLQLRRSRTATIQDFSDVVAADTCLCTKVLSLANSAWFSPKQPITKVSRAISMIGLNNLLPMLLGVSVAGIFNKLNLPPSESKDLWKSSLLKATAARELVLREGGSYPEEAFICGLMQDIALPIMYAADRSAWPLMVAAIDLDAPMRSERERALFGADHVRFGQLLCQRLAMPQLYVVATASHHDPGMLSKVVKDRALSEALSFAAALPHRMSDWSRMKAEGIRRALPDASGAVDATDGQLNELLHTINTRFQDMLAMLGECDETTLAFRQFLQELSSEIARCLESTIGTSSETITRLRQRENVLNTRLRELEQQAQKSDYDELTHLLNRRGFLTGTKRVFELASDFQYGCGIGFVDLDNFKAVNDTYGHAAGDAVLAEVAQVLRQAVGEKGAVGRLGGDEFVFVAVARDQSASATTADQISRQVQSLTVKVPAVEKAIAVTASIGMLWLGVPQNQTAESALKEADRLMYTAKNSGKARLVLGQLEPAA